MSKDIKKALEHCIEWNCADCPNREELGSGETVCRGRLLPEVLEYVADLEAKLAEKENQCRECKNLNKKIELNIKNKLMAENCELQKQLAESEKQIKDARETANMSVDSWCKNRRKYEAQIAEMQNKSFILYSMLYETLEKQGCENVASQIDQMTGWTYDKEADWLKGNRNYDQLKQQLAEKDKELSEYVKIVDDLHKQLSDKCDFCDKTKDQDKISFAIAELEKVKDYAQHIQGGLINYIDNQINELKELK